MATKKLSPAEQELEAMALQFARLGKAAGCTYEQMENFARAGVFLQKKQLEIAATCRMADKPDGPKKILVGGGRGGSKALALDTPILTNKGWSTMGALQVGDIVYDEQGKETTVLETSEIFHNHDCYEFEFDSGEKIVADEGHRWLTISKLEQKKLDRRNEEYRARRRLARGNKIHKPELVGKNVLPPPPAGSVKTTLEIFNTLKYQSGRETNHRIPNCRKLDILDAELPIHPYVLGIWLGDGDSHCGRITSADNQIVDKIASLGYEIYKCKKKYSWNIVGLAKKLRLLGVKNNKHIPLQYLMAGEWQRIELIRGLMDSDGTCDTVGNVNFDNKNKQMADTLVELLATLGVKASIVGSMSRLYEKECGICYAVSFVPPFCAFSLERKAVRQKFFNRKTNSNHYIVGARKVESVPTRCIAVDSPSHLFLAGKRLIPTHNTHCILAQIFCDDCQREKGLKVLALRKVGRANKEQIADFRKKLLGNLQHTYREQAQTIEFANGSTVILGNFKDEKDIDKYLGLEYDLIYIMECNQLSQSKITNILSCLRTNKTDWRPRAYMDTNPGGISHGTHKKEFVDPWKNGTEKETRYIHVTVDDNKFVDPDYKKFLETLVGWQRMAWLEGSWEFMAGSFFSNFDPNVHVYPNEVTDLNPKAIVRWFAGLDYGFSHPTAFSLCCEDEGGNVFVVAEYGESNTLIEQHAANIKDLLALHGLTPDDLEFIAAGKDCFRTGKDGSTVATEYMECGIMLTPTHIDRVNAWSQVAEVFGDPSKQIKPRCFIHKNCHNLISQIQSAQCDEKKPNDIVKMNADENGDGGDDYLENFRNAITMAYTNLLSSAKPIKMGNFQSISEKQTPDFIDVEAELIEAENSRYLIEDNRTFRL